MKKKIFIVAATPMTLQFFMMEQIRRIAEIYNVTILTNWSDKTLRKNFEQDLHVQTIHIHISRNINIFYDCLTLMELFFIFTFKRPHLIHSVTPKGGLLACTAGWLARCPSRIHTFTGQVWYTSKGLKHHILRFMDYITGHTATQILIDSDSQRKFLLQEHIIKNCNSFVLAHGSISGVNLKKFAPCKTDERSAIRAELNLAEDDVVAVFLGRKKRDKGIPELLEAVSSLPSELHIKLLLVGPDEDNLSGLIYKTSCQTNNKVINIGRVQNPERYLQAGDFFCLPSHREGFGSSIIEAAAIGLPALASNIYGIQDAVENGVTGILHEVGNVKEISQGLYLLVQDKDLRLKLGAAAQLRARTLFDSDILTRELIQFYSKNI